MNIHELAGVVARALCKSDDLRRKPWKGSPNVFAGHCYVASEVLYHMGGEEMGLRPAFIHHEGAPHWFLMMDECVLDPTAGQFKTNPDYAKAKHKGFLTKAPSKRACVLIQRVSELLQADAQSPVAHKHIRSQFVQGHVEALVTIKPAAPAVVEPPKPTWLEERIRVAHDWEGQGVLLEYSKCRKCGAYDDTDDGRKPCPGSG